MSYLSFWYINGYDFYFTSAESAENFMAVSGIEGKSAKKYTLEQWVDKPFIEYPDVQWRKAWYVVTVDQFNALKADPESGTVDEQGRKVIKTMPGEYQIDVIRKNNAGVNPRLGLLPLFAGTVQVSEDTDVQQPGRTFMIKLKSDGLITDFYFESLLASEISAGGKTMDEYLEDNAADWVSEDPV